MQEQPTPAQQDSQPWSPLAPKKATVRRVLDWFVRKLISDVKP